MTRDDIPWQRDCLCGHNPDCTNAACPRLGIGRWLTRAWRKLWR